MVKEYASLDYLMLSAPREDDSDYYNYMDAINVLRDALKELKNIKEENIQLKEELAKAKEFIDGIY